MPRLPVLLAAVALGCGWTGAALGQGIEIWAMDSDGTNARKVAAIDGYPTINSPEVSPDGQWIGVDGWKNGQALNQAHLLFVQVETGTVRDLGFGMMPTWSSDGKWIAYTQQQGQSGVCIRQFEGIEARQIDTQGWGIQAAPVGFKTAYVKGGNIVIYDFIREIGYDVFPDGNSPYVRILHNLKWSPDGRRICFKGVRLNGSDDIAIVSATGGEPNLKVRCSGAGFNPDIGWSPDGTRITIPRGATAEQPGAIYVFGPDDDEEPTPLKGQPADRHNSGMCWSRDGKTLYFVSSK